MRAKSPLDTVVGKNIRIYRTQRRLSQGKLADQIGVSFQQVQKYENGRNRVGAGKLMEIARVLNVRIDCFFDGAHEQVAEGPASAAAMLADPATFRMTRAFSEIGDAALRRTLLQLAEQMASRRWLEK
jgi:transcriptional regulator with XRE-family HTH domain